MANNSHDAQHRQSQIQQENTHVLRAVHPSNNMSQYKVPFTPPPLPVLPLTPVPEIEPFVVEPRVRRDVERYAEWLRANNSLLVSVHKLQAYQEAALEIKTVGKREVRTFAPFQEHTSALKVITSDQATILGALILYWLVGLFFLHLTMIAITLGVITVVYVCGFIVSGVLATQSFSGKSGERIDEELILALDQRGVEWPSYTILCPLYKEAAIVPQFVRAIKSLDYPEDRLQILFLTEENDSATRAALDAMRLPTNFTILTVPKGTPQTKPRACNFGLMQAKGQFIVIFDAEDKPEPYQLKKAVLTFANYGPEVACVQAKLNYYNTNQNLLTRWFTAEYSTWFDIMLPGLQRTGFSLPLGGTSNHFRTDVLCALGGWDAFNVTEDCDLGLRISQYNLKTAVLDSTTYEEATSRVKIWLFQRSRWIKGYLQTYLVHMRHPLQMLRRGQIRKFFSLQLIVGVWTVVLLINPFMWALTLLYIIFRPVQLYSVLFPGPILYMGAFCLIFGNFFYIYIHLLGCLRRRDYTLIKWMSLIPLYWVMMSISAYIAFYQLIVKPHYWEKTQHGNHLAPSARPRIGSPSPQLTLERRAVPASLPTIYMVALTVGNLFRRVTISNALEPTTQRVKALRATLSTRLSRARRQNRQPHIRDLWLLATVVMACTASIASCWYFFQQHEILLYGDAYSHMRIARSVFDSATPGLAQLGSVWLPLPHILMWPFIWNDYLWHSGLAGSFVSMPCYVVASAYLFLSARKLTRSNTASFIGTLAFIFNPNILYLQSTPLSETVCIVMLAITCYYFLCWIEDGKPSHLVMTAGGCFLATLARYDGWSLFIALLVLIPIIGLIKRKRFQRIQSDVIIFGVLGGLGIVLWFIWNQIIFGDPLYFQRSQYSSFAQQMQQLESGTLFTYHNLWQSLRYYTIDSLQTVGLLLFVLAVIGLFWFLLHRRFDPMVLGVLAFISPFALYVVSLYTGNAVLWIPGATPSTAHVYLYNVRYGSQIVAPVALCLALLTERVMKLPLSRFRFMANFVLMVVILVQCAGVAKQGIITLQEGTFNYMCNTSVDELPIVDYLSSRYNGGKILEDVSASFSATDAGLDFKNVIYIGSGQLWKQALQNPDGSVDWIIVNPDNPLDLVAQQVNVNSPSFLAQFTLVVQQSNNLRLYHRIGAVPLVNRLAQPPLSLPHHSCNLG